MVEGRGEYGRNHMAGARHNARPCVARGLCDSEGHANRIDRTARGNAAVATTWGPMKPPDFDPDPPGLGAPYTRMSRSDQTKKMNG